MLSSTDRDHIPAKSPTRIAALLWFSETGWFLAGQALYFHSPLKCSQLHSCSGIWLTKYSVMVFPTKYVIYPGEFYIYIVIKNKLFLLYFFLQLKVFLRFSCCLLNLILHVIQDF